MKTFFFLFAGILVWTACSQTQSGRANETSPADTADYDSALAKELGADDYGMSRYVVALLKTGPNRSQDAEEAARLQQAHLENIRRMAEEGKLVLAGPFLDNTDLRGIYVFKVETVEEAEALTSSDPAVQAGRLVMELHPWYGSAAIQKLNEIHRKVARDTP